MAAALVGRECLLSRVGERIGAVSAGRSGAIAFTGLPGVGKTALARATLEAAAAAGFATFAGQARPLSQKAAYAPLVEAFGAPLRAMPAGERGAAVDGIAQLALIFGGLGVDPPAPLGDPALERSRLLDGFVRLAERLAAGRPLALLVDDTALVDEASASVLVQFAGGAAGVPTLLLLTARSDLPTDRVDELTGAFLAAGSWVEPYGVTPLDDAASERLARAVLGRHASDELVARIVARCGGLPLLIDASARTIRERGGLGEQEELPIPRDVLAVLRSRLTGCTPDERSVLDVLAVAGDALGFDTIVAATGLGRDAAVAALDSLERRGLSSGAGGAAAGRTPGAAGFDTAHELLREVVAAQISGIRTQQLHARLVTAIETGAPEDPRIAEHALSAGPLLAPERALDLLVRGGRRARELGMNEAALRYLAAAADLAETQATDSQRAEVLALLGDTHRRLGRPDDARATWQRALDRYGRAGDSEGTARVEQNLGMLAWAGGELADANRHFDNAAAALSGLEPSPAHAGLLYTRTITASRIGDAKTVASTAHALRRLAAELGSPKLEAQALLAESVIDYGNTDYVAMVEKNRLALAAARRSDDPLLVIRAHDQLSVAAASQLDLPLLREHSRTSLQLAIELGARILEGWPRGRLAAADLLGGDWDAALRAAGELIALPRRHGEHRGAVSTAAAYAWVLTHRGRLTEARDTLAEARQKASPMLENDRNVFSIVAIAETWLALAEDDPARAVTTAAQLRRTTGGWMPQLGLALLGEAQARAGEVDDAERIAERLRRIRSCSTNAPDTLAGWVAGLAAVRSGRIAEGSQRLLRAAAGFDRLGMPFLSARLRLAAAAAEADAGGQPETAVPLARDALAVFDSLGAPIEAQRSRELLRRLGVVPSRGRARKHTGSALSSRELEVARAVASGLSNAEVAAALFISPRTVTTHLGRIYTRLGLGSRAALTRYLADAGLLAGPDGTERPPIAAERPSIT